MPVLLHPPAPAPAPAAVALPDPRAWAALLVRGYGECRHGTRPWAQLWPHLDLPVIAELWPQRRTRHPRLLRVAKVIGTAQPPGTWPLTVLVADADRVRAVAVTLEPAAATPDGHNGPPGPRRVPLRRLPPGTQPTGWLATCLHLI